MRSPEDELAELESRNLRRSLKRLDAPQSTRMRWEGREFLNFSSNDYLGLAASPAVKAALCEGVERYGAGSGASRLVCGTLDPHLSLEERLAEFKRTEAALTFSTGYATAVGTITALMGKGDVIILDKLCHASLIDGARLSGAEIRVFPHHDLEKLDSHLRWAGEKTDRRRGRVLVVVESIYSMDGDRSPLAEIVDLKEKTGAWLLVDEAHAFGIVGPRGRGLTAELGVEDRVELQMGTLSKAAGLSGGYLCASRAIVDLLVNRARSFIYSTAPPPSIAYAAREVIERLQGAEGDSLRDRLWSHAARFGESMKVPVHSAIIPILLGSTEAALAAAERMKEAGFLIPAIRYPTVPRNQARLRVTLSAAHETGEIEKLVGVLKEIC